MKAIIFDHAGPPDVLSLAEVPKPIVGTGQALVKVQACGVNRIDLDLRSAIDDEMPMPHILGCDIAGTVVQYGDAAAGPPIGSPVVVSPAIPVEGSDRCRIIGYQTQGGYAEYAAVPASNLLSLPKSLSYKDAAALLLPGMTAHHALFDHARLRAGDRILITGGTGGVGSLAVQMALASGCLVTSTAGSADRVGWLRDQGVQSAINHSDADFAAHLAEVGPYDVIFDHIGGDVLKACIPFVAEHGHIVAIGSTLTDKVTFSLFDLFRSQASISGSYMGNLGNLQSILRMVAHGSLHPVVHKVLPLSAAREAHEMLESRQVIGKIVLSVDA
jgi:NADPH:quinone reductase-like Zn-dependent oxidoreductase